MLVEPWGQMNRQPRIALIAVCFLFGSLPTQAQVTLGSSCSTSGAITIQPDQIVYCTGSTWAIGEEITAAGFVGVGTTGPTYGLDVNGTFRANSTSNAVFGDGSTGGIQVGDSTITKTSGSLFSFGSGLNSGGVELGNTPSGLGPGSIQLGQGEAVAQIGLDSSKDLAFYTGGAASGEAMRISSSGKVGIGSTSPVVSLDLSQKTDALALPKGTTAQRPGTAVNGEIRYNTDSTPTVEAYVNNAWVSLGGGGSSTISLGTSASVTNPQRSGDPTTGLFSGATNTVAVAVGGTQELTVNTTGVGIGTTSPGYPLTVNGQAVATSFTPSSDQRLKKDINTLDNALARIDELRGVSYDWRMPEEREIGQGLSLPTDEHQIGVIAQEVEKVYPEVVGTDNNGVKNVNYNALVGPLIEAVKQLHRELKAEQKKVEAEEQEIQDLRAQLSKQQTGGSPVEPAGASSDFPAGRNGAR